MRLGHKQRVMRILGSMDAGESSPGATALQLIVLHNPNA